MRIGFISTYPPIECGIGTYTCYLNEELRRQNNETFVVSQVGARGVKVFPIYWPESISIAAQIFNISAKMTPDIVHIQHEFGLYGSQSGVQVIELILRYELSGVPVVTTLHTVYEDANSQQKIILRLIISEGSAVIVHEEYQKEILLKNFGQEHEDKIHIIHHGVRRVSNIKGAKARLELEGKKVILLCGYFRPTKGFHRVVKLFPQICKRNLDAVLLIAGKSRGLEFLDYQKEFFESINKSKCNDKIIVLRGQFPQKTFDTILSSSDIVILPYERSGLSGILAQCYAFNKPVVTTDLLPFRLSIERSKGGLIAGSDQEFVENIVKLISNDKLRQQFRNNIRSYIKKDVGWDNVAKSHIKIYQSVVRVPYGRARHVFWE